MQPISVMQFICPAGFYGAEMWILALAKNLNPSRIRCLLAITRESEGQNTELYNRFRSLGLETYQIPMRGRFDPKGIARLCNLIKTENVDIIHTHGYKSDILGLFSGKWTKRKTLSTPHGFENAPDLKLQLYIHLGCMALRRFDFVAPLSQELESDIQRVGVDPAKIQLILNGVDLEEIERERSRNTGHSSHAKNNEKTIGYVGQLIHRKNLCDLLKVFDALWQERKDVRLLVVGDGPQKSELERIGKTLPSSSKIEFLGYRHDRLRLLKEMDLFAMTSSLEGIPRCMMEAMAMGIPVVAYDIPGVDKLIIPEKTGLMAPFGQFEELKECFKRLLFDEDFSAMIGRNGREHITENFSANRMAQEYTTLYEEIVRDV